MSVSKVTLTEDAIKRANAVLERAFNNNATLQMALDAKELFEQMEEKPEILRKLLDGIIESLQ